MSFRSFALSARSLPRRSVATLTARPVVLSQTRPATTSSSTPSSSPSSSPSSTPAKPPTTSRSTVESGHRLLPDEIDWSRSYYGLATEAFSADVIKVLSRDLDLKEDVHMKPDGIVYLPEVRYRRILNEAFGPGAWGLVPRGPPVVGDKIVTREYALVIRGRFISQAQGENNYFGVEQIPRAVEGCKSNALMRCCKDLGIAWQLWDPQFVRNYQAKYAEQVWVEHVVNKKKARIWLKKGDPVPYPYKKS